ncbi:MAG: prolipoprotein diacylglyceryl transferase [Clostridia bacterium]|nr:prolipoprotein diacylglyceryl transferase [Clostridia bacterium]
MTKIAFPNIGIDTFEINPVAISIFGLNIRWYGLIIMCGIILAFTYAFYRSKKEGFTSDDMMDLFIYTVLSGVVGARLYYVLTSLDRYDNIWQVFQIWNGGLGIYGGIIGGALAIFIVCRIKKKNFIRAFDMISPGVMIGQLVGRWGNFCNGEAFGDIERFEFFGKTFNTAGAEKLPFLMEVNSYATGYTTLTVHPTFLYESVWNLAGFIIINALYGKKKFDGQIFLMYIGWYGFGRMFIEGLRADSLYIGGVKISQLIGLLCFVFSVCVITFVIIKKKKEIKNG